jgi:hypothetical protein
VLHHRIAENLPDGAGPIDRRQKNRLSLADPGSKADPAFHAFVFVDPGFSFLRILLIQQGLNGARRAVIHAQIAANAFSLVDSH